MVYTGTKQPALLYIIPSLFITTFVTAGLRREWGTKLSMDSNIETERFNAGLNKSPSKLDVEASARGLARFDAHKFAANEPNQEFRKFEDDNANEIQPM